MSGRGMWQTPSLVVTEGHRKVSWLELFYDLFFVVTIAQLAHGLAGNFSVDALWAYALLFVPVWWMWIGSTYYMERFETEGLETRLVFFALMFPVAGLAVFQHDAMGASSTGFALSYALGRAIITGLWLRATIHVPEFRPTGRIYTAGFLASVLLFISSVFVSPGLRFVLWGVALFIDMVTPWLTLKHQARLPRFSTSKLPERFGLFILIVLGESIAGAINALAESHAFSSSTLAPAVLGITLGFALWWIYFDFISRRPAKPRILASILWSYLHLPLAMGMAAVGASIGNAIRFSAGSLETSPMPLYAGAVALTLAAMGVLELLLAREADEPTHPRISPGLKLSGAGAIALLALPAGGMSPSLVQALILSVLLLQMAYGVAVWYGKRAPRAS